MRFIGTNRHKLSQRPAGEAWIDRALKYADFCSKIVSIAAVAIAGYWTIHLFNVGGGNDWMINLDMQVEVLPYDQNLRLLVVHVRSKNPRVASFDFEPEDGAYELSFRKIGALKENDIGDEDQGQLLRTVSLMPDDGIVWAPYAEFDDMRTLVVPKGITVVVNAALHVKRHEGVPVTKDEDYVNVSKAVQVN